MGRPHPLLRVRCGLLRDVGGVLSHAACAAPPTVRVPVRYIALHAAGHTELRHRVREYGISRAISSALLLRVY
mgnify:CR=1 FL=1